MQEGSAAPAELPRPDARLEIRNGPRSVVAVGLAEGGRDALSAVLAAIPPDVDAAFVVVELVSKETRTPFRSRLERDVSLRLVDVAEPTTLERGTVYVAAPGRPVVLTEGPTLVVERHGKRGARARIDELLVSLAEVSGPDAVAVVLSGAGADGAAGVRAVGAAGGQVLVQSPADAAKPSMPERAVAAGRVDAVLDARALGVELARRLAPVRPPAEIGIDGPFREIIESLGEVTWVRDTRGALRYVSPSCAVLFGVPPSRMCADSAYWLDAIHPEDRDRVRAEYGLGLRARRFTTEYRVVARDGRVRWLADHAMPAQDASDLVVGLVVDITDRRMREEELRKRSEQLEEQANNDPLTGLLNRRGLDKRFAIELERLRRASAPLCAVLVDCDDFKSINDAAGLPIGDVVLQQISRRIQDTVRPADLTARIGGDEFLVLLPETRLREGLLVAERLRLAIAGVCVIHEEMELRPTASFGVAAVPRDTLGVEEVVAHAQHALRLSKEAGKNRVHLTQPGTDRAYAVAEPKDLVARLRDGDGFRTFRQPIVELATGRVVANELLTRGPEGSFESPEDFFRIAVEFDVLTAVDLECLRHAVDRGRRLPPDLDVHLNLHPTTLAETPRAKLIDLLGNLQPRSIVIELSEQQLVGDPHQLEPTVRELRAAGLRLALDHVGFGRSSLESLIVLEPEFVKFDPACVHGVGRDPARRRPVERLVHVCRSLDATIVATCIESAEDAEQLFALGVTLGQGFWFGRPEPVG